MCVSVCMFVHMNVNIVLCIIMTDYLINRVREGKDFRVLRAIGFFNSSSPLEGSRFCATAHNSVQTQIITHTTTIFALVHMMLVNF